MMMMGRALTSWINVLFNSVSVRRVIIKNL